MLTNRDSQRGISAPVKPVPANVGVAAICWPLGQPMSRSDPNCRRQRFAWTLDNTTPPTLQALDQPLGVGLMESVWVNAKGLRVDAHCPGAQSPSLSPCGPHRWNLGCHGPNAAKHACRPRIADCPPPALAASSPLSIVGVREGDQLRLPAASQQALRLKISALGGSGRRWWFLNGAPLGDSANQDIINASFERLGRYQLSVLDEAGQTARIEFSVVD